jgi:NUMOD3 motif
VSTEIFYVYEHWRPDKDACFYVGKGKYQKRAFDIKNRSRWHKAITSKLTFLGLCVDVRIYASNLEESEAFRLEIERIAYWRSLGVVLVNFTDGGEGKSGGIISEETREKMRSAAAVRNQSSAYLEKLRIATTARWQTDGYKERLAPLISAGNKGKVRGPPSIETRQKIGSAHKGRKHGPMSAEIREKIGAAHRGRTLADETRKKISQANTGKKRSAETIRRLLACPPISEEARAKIGAVSRGNKYRLGKTHTAETKDKLRQLGAERLGLFKQYSHLGPAAQAKAVICLDDGVTHQSANAAAKYYGLKNGNSITAVCLGKPSRSRAAGRRFKYVEAA